MVDMRAEKALQPEMAAWSGMQMPALPVLPSLKQYSQMSSNDDIRE